MNLLTILLNAQRIWESLPDGEKTLIIDAIDGLVQKALDHKEKMANQPEPRPLSLSK